MSNVSVAAVSLHWQGVIEILGEVREECQNFELEVQRVLDEVDRLREELERQAAAAEQTTSPGKEFDNIWVELTRLRELLEQV